MSPEAPVTYREFSRHETRVDAALVRLDGEKADAKDVDALHDVVRALTEEVHGLRRVLVGVLVALALAAVGAATTAYQVMQQRAVAEASQPKTP